MPRKNRMAAGKIAACIGVYRPYIDTPTTDPEIKALTEQALKDLADQAQS